VYAKREMWYFCIEKEKESLMKNRCLIKSLIIALLCFVFTTVQAFSKIPEPAVAVKKVNAKAFRLYVKTLDHQATVEIKNQFGELLLTEVLAKGYIYRKTYDISDLPGEIYYVKVSDPHSTKEFAVFQDSVRLLVDEEITTKDSE
jgi:hypothetical protein